MAPKLEARAKQDYKLGPVLAFSGHEFVKYEWRPVPEGYEEPARTHELLDVREIGAEAPIEEGKGSAEEYLADKKGTADQYVEKVLKEAKGESETDKSETPKGRKPRKSKAVTTETEEN